MPRVLIADDVPDNVKLLKFCLEDEGFEVVTATNGQEAIDAAREHRPDTILLDVMMPVMDGIEACRQLKADEQVGATPIILVTALDDESDVVRGLDAGADDYVTKPINERIVVARTRGAVNRYHAIVENRKLIRELQCLATTDSLTGLLNRRTFFEHFERELQLANRHDTQIACVMADIDFFKKVNDDYGHQAGDATLRSFAELLQQTSRETDYLCRYGGEEFVALLTLTNEYDAAKWAESVRSAVGQMTISTGTIELTIAASFGVAGRLNGSPNTADLLEQADRALAFAKQSGRNQVVQCSDLDENRASQTSPLNQSDHVLRGVLAREVMTRQVSCVSKETPLAEVAQLLIDIRTNTVPVVDSNGIVIGVISEKDIMLTSRDGNLSGRIVSDHMSANAVQYGELDSAQDIFDFFCRNALRRVVVVKEGRPIGMISRGNLLSWINAHAEAVQLG